MAVTRTPNRFTRVIFNFNIGQRLQAAFLLINLIFLAVAVVAILGLLNQRASLTVLQFNQEQGNYSKEILKLVQVQQQATWDSLQAIGQEERDAAAKKLEDARTRLTQVSAAQAQSSKKGTLTAKEKEFFAAIDAKRTTYDTKVADFITILRDKNSRSDQFESTQKEVTELGGQMIAALKNLDDFGNADSTARMESIHSGATTILSVVLACTGAALLISFILGALVRKSITAPLALAVHVAESVANGDLTDRVDSQAADETGQLLKALGRMVDNLSDTVRQVRETAEQVNTMSGELATSSASVLNASREQSDAAAATAASVEQVTVSIGTISDTADDVLTRSQQSYDATQQGAQSLTTLVAEVSAVEQAVKEIASTVASFVDSTRSIASLTQQVKDIANQTNLLALNAAIEAARAGEQGRGFAVVADEVRKLAEKSSQSAQQIDQVTQSLNGQSGTVELALVKGMNSLEKSLAVVNTVESSLTQAAVAVENANGGINGIAVSVREQKAANTAIARYIEKVAQMAEENTCVIEKTAGNIDQVSSSAKGLLAAVSRFRV
ncbi:MAG: methyl-accepting chemotaxis sensory transducer [Proteobacteria bacterium]|nr:methyl-accepting chemotaxis sensory transducer [Pseudomonadota bacterium]